MKINRYLESVSFLFRFSVLCAALVLAGCADSPPPEDEASASAESAPPVDLSRDVERWPVVKSSIAKDPDIEARVAELLASMTLEQKVAQMIQPEIRDVTIEDMRRYGFGSYLNGGGSFPNLNKHATAADWIALAEAMYQASIDDSLDGTKIPTMWGTDAVHGHNNVIGATLFPHNIGLGAMDNPELIQQIAEATAKEVMATGIDWVFAPTVAVPRDDRWGRTYEGYSEDPEITRAYSAAIVEGLQGAAGEDFLSDQRVIATIKHFVGDGGTVNGDDQGDNISSESEMINIHAQGYVSGIAVGAQTVMASFNSWHGEKMHGSHYMLTQVLKERIGFDGLIVGDWNGHGQVKGCSNSSCAQAVNAGMDILMAPTATWKPLLENTIAQVKSGEISMARIDDAVTRILRVKIRAGLFDKPSPSKRPLAGKTELIGAQAHRDVARQAVRESLVLLKNKHALLPLSPKQKIFVTGDAADNIGKQSGGWTITWQGTNNVNEDFPGASSIYDGIKAAVEAAGGQVELGTDDTFTEKPDVAIVVFGEEPYAEGVGDINNLEYQRGNKSDLALLQSLKTQGIPVVSIFISGRPLWVNAELNASDAFVAAWLPGSEGVGVADVVMAKADGSANFDFSGKLSYSWPKTPDQAVVNRFDSDYAPLLPYGFGLGYGNKNVLGDDLPEESASGGGEQVADMVLFASGPKAPWRVMAISGDMMEPMKSNTLQLGSLNIRTTDRKIQEDALQIDWDGTDEAHFSLAADFPEDLRAYIEADTTLSFDVVRLTPVDSELSLSMACGRDCFSSVDITPLVATLSSNEWKKISVDMKCFATEALALDKIYAPFSLTSNGKLSIQVSDIVLKPFSSASADISCTDAP